LGILKIWKTRDEANLLISNFHIERIAHKYKKAFLIRGFPDYEQTGAALRNNVLYEGSCAFLNECANMMISLGY
jgi:nitrogenase molybdenum-iron protein NifN